MSSRTSRSLKKKVLIDELDEECLSKKQADFLPNGNDSTPVADDISIHENEFNAEMLESIFSEENSPTSTIDKKTEVELTAAEKARCERNRQKALLLRQSRLSNQQLQGDFKKTIGCSRSWAFLFFCSFFLSFSGIPGKRQRRYAFESRSSSIWCSYPLSHAAELILKIYIYISLKMPELPGLNDQFLPEIPI